MAASSVPYDETESERKATGRKKGSKSKYGSSKISDKRKHPSPSNSKEYLESLTIPQLQAIIRKNKHLHKDLRISVPKENLIEQILLHNLSIYSVIPSPRDPIAPTEFSPKKPSRIQCEGYWTEKYRPIKSSTWRGKILWMRKAIYVQNHMDLINNYIYDKSGQKEYLDEDYNICWNSKFIHRIDYDHIIPTEQFYNYINQKYKDIGADIYIPNVKSAPVRPQISPTIPQQIIPRGTQILHPDILNFDDRLVGIVLCQGRNNISEQLANIIDIPNVQWVYVDSSLDSDPDIYIEKIKAKLMPSNFKFGVADFLVSFECNRYRKENEHSILDFFENIVFASQSLKSGGIFYWYRPIRDILKWISQENIDDNSLEKIKSILSDLSARLNFDLEYRSQGEWFILKKQ